MARLNCSRGSISSIMALALVCAFALTHVAIATAQTSDCNGTLTGAHCTFMMPADAAPDDQVTFPIDTPYGAASLTAPGSIGSGTTISMDLSLLDSTIALSTDTGAADAGQTLQLCLGDSCMSVTLGDDGTVTAPLSSGG
ncbi:MAG: hypothetical protein ACYDCQ_06910 [Dehalococcoidia bacterium]